MARSYHRHTSGTSRAEEGVPVFSDSSGQAKQEFSRRLYNAMIDKRLTQAELARKANILADSVSNYVRGNVLPGPKNLRALAEALGVKEDDLMPLHGAQAIGAEREPHIDLRVSSTNPSKAWLRVNKLVDFKVAAEIIQMLKDGDAETSD